MSKLDDRLEWLDRHTDEYLRQLGDMDEAEDEALPGQLTRKEVEAKLRETQERLERYRGYREYMEQKELSQIFLSDPDAKLIKSKNGFMVAYNVQTVVDSETHMIEDYMVTNQVTDHGLIGATVAGIKEKAGERKVEAVTDMGYNEAKDMAACLQNGIIPNVMLPDGEGTYEFEISYEGMGDTTDTTEASDRIKRNLRAGIIPEEYKGTVESAKVIEKKVLV